MNIRKADETGVHNRTQQKAVKGKRALTAKRDRERAKPISGCSMAAARTLCLYCFQGSCCSITTTWRIIVSQSALLNLVGHYQGLFAGKRLNVCIVWAHLITVVVIARW